MSFRNISVLLTANSTSLRQQLTAAANRVDSFGTAVEKKNKGIVNSTQLMQAAVVGAATAVAAAMGYSVVAAAKFEQSMRNVNSISGLSAEKFNALSKEVLNLSTSVPQSATQLADGLYDIASSGFQGAEGLKVLEAAAVAASAGMSTTATSAKAITAVLNAYGLGADQAQDVSDTLFQTVNLGVLSFEELAGSIGDVVGIAAVTGVTVDQLGGAIAAMTKQGISGSESATLLTNLFTKMLRPSEALATKMRELGYESGEAMLKANGLRGSMEILREATGGNATALFNLFPDIQAARGALALMANEGRTYAEVAGEIEDKSKRAGATLKTFQEQSKAVTFQFKLFVNQINKNAIVMGTKLLPVVLQAMKAMQRLGRGVGEALTLLAPFFKTVGQIGADLINILGEMAKAAAPAIKVLAGIAFLGLVETLEAIAGAVKAVTGFFAEYETAAAALGAVIAVALLPSLTAMVAALSTKVYVAAVLGIVSLIDVAGKATAAFTGMGLAATFATAGFAAVAAAGVYAFQKIDDASEKGAASVEKLLKRMGDPGNDPQEMGRSISALTAEIQKNKQVLDDIGVFSIHNPFSEDDPAGNARGAIEEAKKNIELLEEARGNAAQNISAIYRETGLAHADIVALASKSGTDLTASYEESSEAREKIVNEFLAMEQAAQTSGSVLQEVAGADLKAMEALAEQIKEVTKATGEAFQGDTSVIGNFKIEKDGGSAGVQLKAYYQRTITEAKTFTNQINEATKRGLDPQMVSRLLQAGPQAAGPILQGLLSDHSGKMIQMANESEEALRSINTKVVEFARLTTLATTSSSDQMVKDLGAAMEIAAENMAQGANGTVASVAKALKMGEPEVRRIAGQYGITFVTTAQGKLNGNPLKPKVELNTAEMDSELARFRNRAGQNVITIPVQLGPTPKVPKGYDPRLRAATGGYVKGPGTGTSDSIPARLSNGEFVVRAAAVKSIGVDNLHAMNAKGYAKGGYVGRMPSSQPAGQDISKTIAKAVASAIREVPRNQLTVTVPQDKPNRYAGAVVEEAVFAARLGRLS